MQIPIPTEYIHQYVASVGITLELMFAGINMFLVQEHQLTVSALINNVHAYVSGLK